MSPKKFTEDVRAEYIESLRTGNLKFESARLVGISYRTIERHRHDDDDFRDLERLALMEAREGIEKVLFKMALEGDLGAIDRWMKAHDRSTYGDKQVLEINATQGAVEMSAFQALAKVAELQITLAERHARLTEIGDVIETIETPSIVQDDVPAIEAPAHLLLDAPDHPDELLFPNDNDSQPPNEDRFRI